VAPDLRSGERAIAVVRPEATRIEAAAAPFGGDHVNRIPARMTDSVAVGPSLRLRATTAAGQEFEAVMRRDSGTAPDFHPGEEVLVAFDASALRVYRADKGAQPSLI